MVTADKINLSELKVARGSSLGITNLIKSSQDNIVSLGGPSALRSSHGHSQSMFIPPKTNHRRSSIPEQAQKNVLQEINKI